MLALSGESHITSYPESRHTLLIIYPLTKCNESIIGWTVSSPQISNPAEKVEGSIPHGYEGVLTEENGLCPVGWLGELGKHDPSHTGLGGRIQII